MRTNEKENKQRKQRELCREPSDVRCGLGRQRHVNEGSLGNQVQVLLNETYFVYSKSVCEKRKKLSLVFTGKLNHVCGSFCHFN